MEWLSANIQNFIDERYVQDSKDSDQTKDTLDHHCADENDRQKLNKSIPETIEMKMVGCFSHHIYNEAKKAEIVKGADKYCLTGLYKFGKPGFLVVEGRPENVNPYISRLKGLRWQLFKVRFETVSKINLREAIQTDPSIIEDQNGGGNTSAGSHPVSLDWLCRKHKKFSSFEPVSSESDLRTEMEKRGLSDWFYDLLAMPRS